MNPFDKYFKGEDILQKQVAEYLNYQYKNILWTHCPNEGKRSPFERYKAKAFGIKSGVPDIMIYEPKAIRINGTDTLKFVGLAIELKWEKNKTTAEQDAWLQKLKDKYWATSVCYSFDETVKIINDYLS